MTAFKTAVAWLVLTGAASAEDAVRQHIQAGITSYERGDLAGAISELRKALRLSPEDPHVQFMLGNAFYRAGDLKEAAASYGEALHHKPGDFECRMSRGFTFYELRDLTSAIADWSEAVHINPREPFARAALAIGLYSVGAVEEALNQYEQAMIDSRYRRPEMLRVDIRWKPEAIQAAKQLVSKRSIPPSKAPRNHLLGGKVAKIH